MSSEFEDNFDPPDTANSGAGPSPVGASTANTPPVDDARKANVTRWVERIKASREHFKGDFKRMRECRRIVRKGADKTWADDNYTVPILGRQIRTTIAALYARNPTAVAKRKKKMQFKLWDGEYSSLEQAYQSVMGAAQQGMPPDPNAMALVQEVQTARQENVQMDRMGKTLELLFDYFLNEQDANYKAQMKSWVRQAKVDGVGYMTLGFQRAMQPNPDVTAKMGDVTDQIAHLKQLLAEQQEGDLDAQSAELDELRSSLADLQQQAATNQIVTREGPVLGFPASDKIIVDPCCVDLRTFAGANWIAQEFDLSPAEIQAIWQVDVGGQFSPYRATDTGTVAKDQEKAAQARVWVVQDKQNQQVFAVCDGYADFIQQPAAPDVKIDRFWTVFSLLFNQTDEDDDAKSTIYPLSDVWSARHMQREYNSVREGLREHRIQNRPKYAAARGRLEEADKKNLANAESGTVIEINGMGANDDISKILQPIKTVGIDPNLYETSSIVQDIQRAIGSQDADLGAVNSASATESSIAEQGRTTVLTSDTDEIDDVLTELARAFSQLCLSELSPQTVQEIAGSGAVWPDMQPTREQIAKDLWLEIKAGSSGRPNRAAELANMERGLPYLLQIPGINPYPLGRRYGDLLDLDVDEIVIEGLPSIVAQNAAAGRQMQPGSGATDPNAQGSQGGQNAPVPAANEPGPQPGYPAPMATNATPPGAAHAGVPQPVYAQPKVGIGPPAAVLRGGP